jgi:hypothetical protein
MVEMCIVHYEHRRLRTGYVINAFVLLCNLAESHTKGQINQEFYD